VSFGIDDDECRMKQMVDEKRENQDETGILYNLNEKIREILT
jgi:hypothetical protein